MRHALAAVALALAALSAVPAAAAGAEDTAVVVSYADLDLTKPAGTQALQARIDKALDKVCDKPDIRDLKAMQSFEACQAEGRDAAMQQLSLANPFDGIELASAF
ncbi:MAG: UrcA family protein [Croceibacterium sp.]